MKILYVTKHYNHCGYLILEKLIQQGFNVIGVLLPNEKQILNNKYFHWINRLIYRFECLYYKCEPIKALNSEEILAKRNKIKVYKTDSMKSESFFNQLCGIFPDIIVIGGGWHELIPAKVFTFPNFGTINVHPSLLPDFRGTSITRWQVLFGVNKSGCSITYVNKEFDKGDILLQRVIDVKSSDTPQDLFYRIGLVSSEIIISLLEKFANGEKVKSLKIEKKSKFSKYYSKWDWSKSKLLIDWNLPLNKIHYFVNANTQESYKYLGPIFTYNNKKYFLRKTNIWPIDQTWLIPNNDNSNFKVVKRSKSSVYIWRKTEKFILELLSVQLYNKFYFINRACNPTRIINNKIGEEIILT